MARDLRRADLLCLALLAVLPVLAYSPAVWEGRLLGPGDGAALHYPMKVAVWEAYRRGELPSWNPSIFLGTPLLASYRPGALFPLVVALSLLPHFAAFQALVLVSLAAAALLVYLYVRLLGAAPIGAYFAGLSFSLGPYLVAHLGDTATLVAAPTLPLLLLAAEAQLRRSTPWRCMGLGLAVALLLLAGSPEASRAGAALLAGRLLVALLFPAATRPRLGPLLGAALAGVLLAAPQLVPTLLAAREAGPSMTGLAAASATVLPGATGLVLRYASHTPSPSLALAALPLTRVETPVRVLGVALLISLILQWGRGPLAAPGALALVFDLTLAILAGLSLSSQWRARRQDLGRRLRAYFLFACLASAAGLSVAAAALGPLPVTLAAAVGNLTLALILYFSNAESEDPVRAGMWLLPLTVSFLLQPYGRGAWEEAPTEEQLHRGSGTRQAIERALGLWRTEANLSLVQGWPDDTAGDLAFANLGVLSGRRSVNGYDPMVSLRTRRALGDMSSGGSLPPSFFSREPARLEWLGVRWVQLPASSLGTGEDRASPAGAADLVAVVEGRPRFFPLPIAPATEIRLAFLWQGARSGAAGPAGASVAARLASGRDFAFPLPLGADATAGPNVTLALPGRYFVDGLRVECAPCPGRLLLSRLAVRDARTGRVTAVSPASAYISDAGRFRETAATPFVRLFEVSGSLGRARVVERIRVAPDEQALERDLAAFDARHEALLLAPGSGSLELPAGSLSSRAEVVRALGGSIEARAQGPGLLVIAESWDAGWAASLDGRPVPLLRANGVQLGLVLPEGIHRAVLEYTPRGFGVGVALAGLGAISLAVCGLLCRVTRGSGP